MGHCLLRGTWVVQSGSAWCLPHKLDRYRTVGQFVYILWHSSPPPLVYPPVVHSVSLHCVGLPTFVGRLLHQPLGGLSAITPSTSQCAHCHSCQCIAMRRKAGKALQLKKHTGVQQSSASRWECGSRHRSWDRKAARWSPMPLCSPATSGHHCHCSIVSSACTCGTPDCSALQYKWQSCLSHLDHWCWFFPPPSPNPCHSDTCYRVQRFPSWIWKQNSRLKTTCFKMSQKSETCPTNVQNIRDILWKPFKCLDFLLCRLLSHPHWMRCKSDLSV